MLDHLVIVRGISCFCWFMMIYTAKDGSLNEDKHVKKKENSQSLSAGNICLFSPLPKHSQPWKLHIVPMGNAVLQS